jgi:soluble lytic murein transglycosylase-like protein
MTLLTTSFRATLLASALALCAFVTPSCAASPFDGIISSQAAANGVPEALVHRVIIRESKYQPHVIGRGGALGLMQIKLATARGLGYTGDAQGLLDPDTNLTYGVRYLAGAYRTANGNFDRAVAYYAGGYYYAAKRPGRHAALEPFSANALQLH